MTRRSVPGPSMRARVEARARPFARRLRRVRSGSGASGRISGVVERLRDWEGTADYSTVRPAHSYTRRAARTLSPGDHQRLRDLARYDVPEAFSAVVPGGRVIATPEPVVLSADCALLWESAYEHLRVTDPPRGPVPAARRLPGRYLVLFNQFWENHFHWIVDVLPRVALLPVDEEPDTPILVPAGLSPVQLDLLAALGLPADRLVPIEHPHLQVDELVLPSFVGRPGYPPRWAVQWLRERLAPEPAGSRRRLWISRAAATRGHSRTGCCYAGKLTLR